MGLLPCFQMAEVLPFFEYPQLEDPGVSRWSGRLDGSGNAAVAWMHWKPGAFRGPIISPLVRLKKK